MLKKLIVIVTHGITTLLLSAAFIVGIGITSIVARALGKMFLANEHGDSSWESVTGSSMLKRMF